MSSRPAGWSAKQPLTYLWPTAVQVTDVEVDTPGNVAVLVEGRGGQCVGPFVTVDMSDAHVAGHTGDRAQTLTNSKSCR